MFVSEAYAQALDAAANVPPAPNPMWNLGMLVVMIVLFYVLLIMPQQKRFKEHSKMLSALEKGDAIVTGGGLIGKVSKVVDEDTVEIDLGNKQIVTAKRSTISGKVDDLPAALKAAEKPAQKSAKTTKAAAAKPAAKTAAKKAPAKKTAAKKPAAKKTPAKKKTTAKKAANDKA